MTGADVRAQVSLILSQAKDVIAIRDGNASIGIGFAGKHGFDAAPLVRETSVAGEPQSEQLDLLRALHSSLSADLRDEFWTGVQAGLAAGPWAAQVIAHLAVELRRLDQLPEFKTSNLGHTTFLCHLSLWNGVRAKLTLQPSMFADSDLAVIGELASRVHNTVIKSFSSREGAQELMAEISAVFGTMTRIRYLRLKQALLSTENPELNTDRKELVNRVESLQFSPSIAAAIQQTERQIRSASTELDFRGCMDLLRVTFEEIFEESAKRIESRVGKSVPAGPAVGNFQPFKQYLENAGLLSAREAEVVQRLYNYVSQEGSHSLIGAPEQLRVTKNTIIEWSLMLVGRIKGFVE